MSDDELQAENAELRLRLEEAEETIRAIRSGGVDAFVVEDAAGHRIYTLEGADRPYRRLVEQMQQGAATLQADGIIAYCNVRLADLLGMAHEKLIGACLRDFVATEDQRIYDSLLGQGRNGLGQGEAHLQRSDGGLVPSYLTFNALSQDGCAAVVGVLVTDLTTQRHHEQLSAAHDASRASEARLRLFIEHAPAAIAVFDADMRYLAASSRWLADYGLADRKNVIGESHYVVVPGVPEHWREVHRRGLAGEVVRSEEDGFERADGSVQWLRWEIRPWHTNSTDVGGVIMLAEDITERKRLGDELRRLADDLSDADRRKNEFLAMLAHELRNPLASIRNACQVLRLASGDAATVQSASEMMERQIGQMVRLVDDLLDISRVSRGKIDLRQMRVDLATVVQHAVEAARALAQCMQHDLIVTMAAQPIHLHADPVRLVQVLGNLLSNACKFTDKGGRVELAAEREGDWAVIRVRDSGIGIDAAQLSRIFDMFAQIDTSIERSVGGLGIGLTLVKHLVEMHQGTVQAHSAGSGRGSEFVVRLPALPDTEETAPEPIGRMTSASAQRILVVDDNRDAADSLAMLLQLSGHETHIAYDGLEAIEMTGQLKPDVILLDIGLPKLNGYETARRIREQPWGKNILLVTLTGWGQEEDRKRSGAAGFDGHMVKPVDYDALMKLIAEKLPATNGSLR